MNLAEWLRAGPLVVSLSSSYFGFFAHGGAWCALSRAGVVPSQLTGASAGAVVAAAWASGLSVDAFRDEITTLRRADIWDPRPGFGLLRGEKLRRRLARSLPVDRIEACPTSLAISVFDIFARKSVALREGSLTRAVQASCAVPLLFHPVRGERWWWDGGVADAAAVMGREDGMRSLCVRLDPEVFSEGTPEREGGAVTVTLGGFERPGFFHLERGPGAFDAADAAMTRLLDSTV